ncbi:MAG: glutaredoxin family protein [Bermanella sp.]
MNIQLLGTTGCHLCDVAEKIMGQLSPALALKVEKLDIASSDALVTQYGMSIPVLRSDSGQELCWPFDAEQVLVWSQSL